MRWRANSLEEGGVTLGGEPPLFAVYFNSTASPRDHVALFVVRAFQQEPEFRANAEIVGRGFFSRRTRCRATRPAQHAGASPKCSMARR